MGRIVYCPLDSVTIGAEGTLDVWSLMAAATNKLILHGWEITSDATTAAILELNLRYITTVGSGGNAETEAKADVDDGAITGSVRSDDTTEGTGVTKLMSYQWEQLGPLGIIYTPQMMPRIEVSQGIALYLTTTTGFECSGWICWEEL